MPQSIMGKVGGCQRKSQDVFKKRGSYGDIEGK